jgi:hypothetical protein
MCLFLYSTFCFSNFIEISKKKTSYQHNLMLEDAISISLLLFLSKLNFKLQNLSLADLYTILCET